MTQQHVSKGGSTNTSHADEVEEEIHVAFGKSSESLNCTSPPTQSKKVSYDSRTLPEDFDLGFLHDKFPKKADCEVLDNLLYILVIVLTQLSAGTLQL